MSKERVRAKGDRRASARKWADKGLLRCWRVWVLWQGEQEGPLQEAERHGGEPLAATIQAAVAMVNHIKIILVR